MKKFITLLLSLAMICPAFATAPTANAFASDVIYPKIVNEKDVKVIPAYQLTGTVIQKSSDKIQMRGIVNDIYYKKVNTTYSNEWSPYKRVSDNVAANAGGGSITSTIEVTFGTDVSGDVYGISIGSNVSLTSSKSYTLNVPPYSRCYMAYRVNYKVERGTRQVCTGIVNEKVLSSNSYVVKTPQYGEYTLINY